MHRTWLWFERTSDDFTFTSIDVYLTLNTVVWIELITICLKDAIGVTAFPKSHVGSIGYAESPWKPQCLCEYLEVIRGLFLEQKMENLVRKKIYFTVPDDAIWPLPYGSGFIKVH